jgi:hypothetical protein
MPFAFKAALVRAFAMLLFAVPAATEAHDGHWEPPGIRPAAVSLDAVLSAAATAAGKPATAYGRRTESWILRAGAATLRTVVTVRDADLRFATVIDGAEYEQGRAGAVRWRRTPNGLVRKIASDVQGDDLDRWPLAFFPFSAADCTLLGSSAAQAAWVVEYRPAHDSPHWFFFDMATGLVTREMFREGSRNVTFTFSDFRVVDGVRRPFAWEVSGAGGGANVAVETVSEQPVAAESVAIPESRTDGLAQFGGAAVSVPADFPKRTPFDLISKRILIDATVNGRPAIFLCDTGTSQILIGEAAARRFGLQPTLRHAIARDLKTGPIHFENVAVQIVPLGNVLVDGILGYEYFAGHIVHIEYRSRRVEFIPSTGFVPPAGAREIDASFEEGMPLAPARIGSIEATRVVLDTGSWNVILLRDLFERNPMPARKSIVDGEAHASTVHFLEGEITVVDAKAPSIEFAGVHFVDNDVQVEEQNMGDEVDFPIDAIFGTHVLAQFDWWFDYDAGRIWVRPN